MDTSEKHIVAIAAEPREFAGLIAHATAVEAVKSRAGYSCRARINGKPWLLVADGPGPNRASAASEIAFELGPVEAVISTGFCGGLDPDLRVGDVFLANRVIGGEGGQWEPGHVDSPSASVPAGALLSRDTVVVSRDEKAAAYRESGARVVEMEAAAVARAAQQRCVPFYCVRVVSDAADDTLPLNFNLYRSPSGRFRRGRILAAALARPWSIPGLIRLNKDSLRAARCLGDFLVSCRF